MGPAWLLLLLTTTAASPLLSRVRRIVGGKKSRAGKYPWQAYLELTDKAGEETRYFTVEALLDCGELGQLCPALQCTAV